MYVFLYSIDLHSNLYWTDWNREGPKIEMSTLNGRDRKILVNQHLALPNALTFDRVNKQLCWADAGNTAGGMQTLNTSLWCAQILAYIPFGLNKITVA